MGAKIAKAYGRVVCAGVAFFLIFGLHISSSQATCWITVDGWWEENYTIETLETSRTMQAAEETYYSMFGYVNCFGQPISPEINDYCVGYNYDMFGMVCQRSVCIGGEWSQREGCTTSPACMEFNIYKSGTWDVVCDNSPVIGDGPFVSIDWKVMPTSLESPCYIDENTFVLWTFSDDFASCEDDCTHTAEYKAVCDESWTALTVTSDAEQGYAYVGLPVDQLQNATTYAFRFTLTDCAGQSIQSETYYFRVATSDDPPAIGDGPLLTDRWQVMPVSSSRATLLDQDTGVLWTFSDDYASCSGLCTHRARYKKVDAVDWTWIPVSTDPDGEVYAYTELPVEGLEAGTYQFYFDVRDCAGQRTYAPRIYYFKVE